jgi:hypothetical protein
MITDIGQRMSLTDVRDHDDARRPSLPAMLASSTTLPGGAVRLYYQRR